MITVPHMLAEATQLNSGLNRTLHTNPRQRSLHFHRAVFFRILALVLVSSQHLHSIAFPARYAVRLHVLQLDRAVARARNAERGLDMTRAIRPYFGMHVGRHDSAFVEAMSIP